MTIDEQLVAYLNKQCIHNKPNWKVCDTASSYSLQVQVYTKKEQGETLKKS